jgi:hypothetical protein
LQIENEIWPKIFEIIPSPLPSGERGRVRGHRMLEETLGLKDVRM